MVKYYCFDTADLPANHIMLEKVPRGLFPGSKKRKQPAELLVDVLPVAKLPETDEEPTALPVIPPNRHQPSKTFNQPWTSLTRCQIIKRRIP